MSKATHHSQSDVKTQSTHEEVKTGSAFTEPNGSIPNPSASDVIARGEARAANNVRELSREVRNGVLRGAGHSVGRRSVDFLLRILAEIGDGGVGHGDDESDAG